jgi:hypothetical protein
MRGISRLAEEMLLKFARRQFLVYDQLFGITCLSHLQGLPKIYAGQQPKKILSSITTTAEAFNYS